MTAVYAMKDIPRNVVTKDTDEKGPCCPEPPGLLTLAGQVRAGADACAARVAEFRVRLFGADPAPGGPTKPPGPCLRASLEEAAGTLAGLRKELDSLLARVVG